MLTLVLAVLPYLTRLQRAAMIDVLESDYIQMARLKGLPERIVVRRHALRNSLVPVVQGSALTLIYLTGGIVTIEYLFAYPGLGSALTTAVAGRDLPVVQAIVLLLASRLRRRQSRGRSADRPARPAAPDAARVSSTALAVDGRGRRPRRRRLRTLAGSLRYGRTRVGLALLAFVVAARARRAVRRAACARRVGRPARASRRRATFLLGTDYLGHDVLSRVLWGGRSVVWMAFAAATLGVDARRGGRDARRLQPRDLLDDVLMRRYGRHPRVPADRLRAPLRFAARPEARADRAARRARRGCRRSPASPAASPPTSSIGSTSSRPS